MSFMISLCVWFWSGIPAQMTNAIWFFKAMSMWIGETMLTSSMFQMFLLCLAWCTVLFVCMWSMIHVCVCARTMTVPFNNIWLSDPSFRSGHNPMGQSAHTHPKVSIKTNNNIRSIGWDMHRIKAIWFLLKLFLSVCMHCTCSSEILRNCRTFSPFISSLISVCVLLQAASNAVHYAIINGFFGLAEKKGMIKWLIRFEKWQQMPVQTQL